MDERITDGGAVTRMPGACRRVAYNEHYGVCFPDILRRNASCLDIPRQPIQADSA